MAVQASKAQPPARTRKSPGTADGGGRAQPTVPVRMDVPLTPELVQRLQRASGNQFVQRLIGQRVSQQAVIQRQLSITSAELRSNGGRVAYGGIVTALDQYHQAGDDQTRLRLVGDIVRECTNWLATGANSSMNGGRPAAAVQALRDEARVEQRRLAAVVPQQDNTVPQPPDTVPQQLPDTVPEPQDTVPEPPDSVPEPPEQNGPPPLKTLPPPGTVPKARTTPNPVPTQSQPEVAKKTQSPYAVVSREALDAGSQFLLDLRDKRAPIVNDAKDVGSASGLSNCALATLAAIVGGPSTTSRVAVEWQKTMGGRGETTKQKPDPKLQSERMWALQMVPADVELLQAERFINALDSDAFPEGKAYIIGDAQFYGMLQFLMHLATARGSGTGSTGVTYHVHQHGEPGNAMFKEAALIQSMKGYPNGTQFAVFVYSDNASQDPRSRQSVRAHWVYAEKFNDEIVFADYQRNESLVQKKGAFSQAALGLGKTTQITRELFPHRDTPGARPASAYLNMFPLSPDPGDARKNLSFGEGCFVAVVPYIGQAPTLSDREIDASEVAAIIDGVRDRIAILSESRKVGTDEKMLPRNWAAPTGGHEQLEIPSPSLVENEIKELAKSFGISGATTELGSLSNPDKIRIVGHPEVKVTSAAPGGTLIMQNLNAKVKTIDEKGAETTGELPATGAGHDVGTSIEGAISGIGTISAQVTNQGIVFNAYLAHFTDIIHEALHTFERPSMPKHLKEGATEVFSGMVCNRILQRGKDPRFQYAYQADYAGFVLGVQQLADIFGIQTLADMYFTKQGSVKDFWQQTINARFSGADPETVSGILEGLTNADLFPALFKHAISELATLTTAPKSATPSGGLEAEYARQAKDFSGFMDERKQKLLAAGHLGEKKGAGLPDLTTSTDPAAIADRDMAAMASVRNEQILTMLYKVRDQATGENYIDASQRIYNLEQNIAKWTGETPDAVRERLVQPMRVVFQATLPSGVSSTERVYLTGDCAELGDNDATRALPMRRTGADQWEVGVDTFFKRGQTLTYKLLARDGTANRDVKSASVSLPSSKTEVKVAI